MTRARKNKFLFAGLLAAAAIPTLAAGQQLPPNATLYATGLDDPRGIRFDTDGYLYVAEAGTGGTHSTSSAMCDQVPGPVGPYMGGPNARISKISPSKVRTTVASGFPSTVDAMGDLMGVADVAFMNGTLYALVAGGGCSHGNPNNPTGIAQVDKKTGKWSMIANIGAFLKTHPTKYESADDFEPDGSLYGFVVANGLFYAVEPNHGQIISVSPQGKISQLVDISASQGHIVPTSITERFGMFYVGNLNLFPIDPQWARILTLSHDVVEPNPAPGFENDQQGWHVADSKAGFTTVVSVKFGPDGLLYVLELSDAAGFPTPGAGKVVRVNRAGGIEDVVTGLAVPTGMTFGPNGFLFVSNLGALPAGAAPEGSGQILKVTVAPSD